MASDQEASDPFYIISYYIKWVTNSLTYSISASMKGSNWVADRPEMHIILFFNLQKNFEFNFP